MYVQYCISYNQSPIIHVTPVSTATIIQQDPFMLFYQLDEGTMYMHFSYTKCKLAGNRNNTLSMSSIMCLTTMDYLTDEVNTICILYGQSEENNHFRSFKHTWTS